MPWIARDVRPLPLLLLDPSVRVHTTRIAISRLKLSESGFAMRVCLALSHMFQGRFVQLYVSAYVDSSAGTR